MKNTKKTQSKANTSKMTKEEREHIDNMVVLATAIGLVGAIALLYLYRWLNTSYARGTRLFIDVLTWICDAGILASVILFFVKDKDRKYLKALPYLVGIAVLLAFLAHYSVFANVLHIAALNNINVVVAIIYSIIFIYLAATYIYFGVKVKKASSK